MFLEEKKGISTLMFDFSVFFFGWFWFERTNTEIAIKRFLPILLSRPRGTKKKLAVVEFEIRIGRERDKNSKQHVFLENILTKLREDINRKKRFLSGIARRRGGGVYPCPNFLALFQEVHFWSIKRVYFFKNANVLNF